MPRLIIIFLFLASNVFSQQITIKGIIVDAEKPSEAIPNAHIRIKNTSLGCISNTEGEFRFSISKNYIDSTLQISFIGYESFEEKIRNISGSKLTIELVASEYELAEIGVKPPDPVEILTLAIMNRKKNYWQQPINAEGFYREVLFQDGCAKRMSEAACEFYLEPYAKEFNVIEFNKSYYKSSSYEDLDNAIYLDVCQFSQPVSNQVKIIESRSSYDISNTGIDFGVSGGPILPISYDLFNMNWFSPQKTYEKTYEKYLNYSSFKVLHSKWQGKPIYILKGARHIFYIDKESYAIIQYSYKYIPYAGTRKITQSNKRIKKYKSKKDRFSMDTLLIDIKYFPWKGKWYYKSISAKQYFTYLPYKEQPIKLVTENDLMFNATITDNVTTIDDSVCFKNRYNSTLYHYATNYNHDFWENYNALIPTNVQKSILNSLEEVLPLNAQYASKFEYNEELEPPVADKIADTLFMNNETFPDMYSWLENGNEDSIMEYVRKENQFADNYFKRYSTQIRELSNEISEKYKYNNYLKSKEWVKQIRDYSYHFDTIGTNFDGVYRKNKNGNIDTLVNYKKANNDYYFTNIESNPNDSIICYTERSETNTDLEFHLIFKDVQNNSIIDTIKSLSCKWITDTTYLNIERVGGEFFARQLFYQNLNSTESKLLYQSAPDRAIWYRTSQSKKFVFVYVGSLAGVDTVFFINKNDTFPELKLISAPPRPMEFNVEHFTNDEMFYVSTNQYAPKFELYKLNTNTQKKEDWKTIIAQDTVDELKLITKLDTLLIISRLHGISTGLELYSEKTNNFTKLYKTEDKFYTMSFLKLDSLNNIIFKYDTYTTPTCYYSYNVANNLLEFLGSDSISNFNTKNYIATVETCTSNDGCEIPMVIIKNKKTQRAFRKAPVLMETYGGGNKYYYPSLHSDYLHLLDRGFTIVFALVRGSAELGNEWKNKSLKENIALSGDDFGQVASFLINKKITNKDKLFAYGKSYGGFVMSYVANNFPSLFKGIIVDTPAGDLLTNLSDSTNTENRLDYNTLGSPYVKSEFSALKKACPYQNITKQNYPNMLYFAAWQDVNANPVTSVKQVAKLRELKTDTNTLLLRVLMNSGHSAVGGKYITKQAWMHQFMINCMDEK